MTELKYGSLDKIDRLLLYIKYQKQELNPASPLLLQDFMQILNRIEEKLQDIRLQRPGP